MNCDRVFNIFCLYGNVEKVNGGGGLPLEEGVLQLWAWRWGGSSVPPLPFQVKFMKSKPGAAMVEMADGYAVDRAITHLNNNFMFGQKLNVW